MDFFSVHEWVPKTRSLIYLTYAVSLTRENFLDFCSDSLCPLNVEVERVWCVAVTPTEPNEEETVTTAQGVLYSHLIEEEANRY